MTRRKPTWAVAAWATAPGAFPSRSLEHVKVPALTDVAASRRARVQLRETFDAPITVVKTERVDPPAEKDV